MKDGRRHRRIPYTGPIRLAWTDNSGSPRFALAKCIEISESGMRVELAADIPARTIVTMNAERIKVAGPCSVRHSERRGGRFILGLELSQSLTEKAVEAIRHPWELRTETTVS